MVTGGHLTANHFAAAAPAGAWHTRHSSARMRFWRNKRVSVAAELLTRNPN